ncbi:glycoside hydrolase family 128 protein [Bipolaris zeicola 26-R-13]|uniref:Glycoside hydrolase family 128 protein n=1 Tax=Cochliobolus carbonum (strain 26-R-13) TaxID=930089 RepID=W6Y632_COCC2|nr:glycoside hydrolase family 128 protein [Bipolaris zeicola 26-R-13]EUC33273.1 glycoside hydrolase family 128 protein [Bipolaris zeicola 26-R-13]
MSSSIKITGLLALAGSVAAVPHFQHEKFHHRAAYPAGGWGASNNTAPAGTGSAIYGEPTTTLATTSTSTQTSYTTVYVKPSPYPGVQQANVADVATTPGCGATVTVTAKEKVTVTVTPGGGAAAPPSSAAASPSKPAEYAAPSKPAEYAVPSKPAEYPAETPEASASSKPAEYPAETPEAPAPSKPAETPAPSKPAETPVYSASATPSASSPVGGAFPTGTPGLGNMYSGTKRGLAYNNAELCSTLGSSYGFGYNWAQTENNDIGTMFIPMMHKPSDSTADEWLANVDKAVKKGSKAVMGFNECDIAAQCNLSPEAACSSWKEYMNPVKEAHPDVTIIGPSVSNGQAPLGLDWLSRFHTACPDAKVDATNIHFYDVYDDKTIDRFIAHVKQAAETYGQKVWITEFGLNSGSATQEQAASFLKDCMAYLDTSDDVQGYSWFMVGTGENQLNLSDGLSPIGKVYAGSS